MAFLLRCSSFPRGRSTTITRPLASLTRSRLLSTSPFVVQPSSQEIEEQVLGPRNLELAVRHVHRDGLVVVADVVPHDHLDFLNEKMVQDARALQARGKDGPFNYNQGNLQLDAPPVAEYFQPAIFTSQSPPPIHSLYAVSVWEREPNRLRQTASPPRSPRPSSGPGPDGPSAPPTPPCPRSRGRRRRPRSDSPSTRMQTLPTRTTPSRS